ncbi:MAG: Alkaline phosphatase synthesis sensor protein PhoR [Microbacteriaceae bacterium]|jgi:signal transduction histidine kinase|nr:Alkaline phosphatase synthesis sensor protein PhoR [Microbacteriaceae bacterium]
MVHAIEAGRDRRASGPRHFVDGVLLARAIRVLIVLTVVANVVYLGALLLPGDPASALVDIWLSETAQWAPAVLFWLVAVRTGFARWEVVLAAAATTFNTAGDTYYSLAMSSDGNLPSPSLADLGYLGYYPLLMAALVVLVRRQSRKSHQSVALDAALAVLGTSAVLAVILGPIFADATSGVPPLDGIIPALYPLFDLLLVATIVGISASPVLRIGPRWQFLVLGLLFLTGADIAYALLNHRDAYSAGTPLDAAWSIGIALTAVWVNGVDVSPSVPTTISSSSGRTLPVPAISVLAGLGVLLFATQAAVPTFALVLAAATVALSAVPIMFRQASLARLLEGQELVVEQLRKLNASKSDMIGTVSHEMRTPLTSIVGFVELVLDDPAGDLPEDAKDMLRVVDRNARRLENMVDNMLTMTRLESSDATPPAAPVVIARLLRATADSLRPFTTSRDVRLSITCDDSFIVEGDERQLERVFTNVMENAIKFSPAAGVVRIVAAPGTALVGEPSVEISISDSGMGIPDDELPQLFDRFFRASNARDTVVPGAGLGLAIVREIVHAHGGDIAVHSVLGEGTTFRITLPLHQPAR